jgi:WD40 repeat protein/tRNA A-37 threonylcarbamoyl transferase component Bud32
LREVLVAYVEAAERGEAPDRQELLARHPEFAAELAEFCADRDRIEHLAGPLRALAPPPAAASAEAATLAPAGGATAGPPPGTTVRHFGDYELLEEIARGGMGVVYRARQVSLNRTVALKMILAGQLASAAEVQRFHSEAEAVANLDHPHIVPIYEVGEHEGQHYFSMKLIDGGSLAQELASRKGEVGSKEAQRRAATVLATVARAVHHAHQRGLLHRDLKPGNILLDSQGQPHVTDFGLAKRVAGDSTQSRSGHIVGTPGYMSPEQARSEKVLSTGTDVYSLGAILYELLTGRPPFLGATPLQTVLQVMEQEPARPRLSNPNVDRDLETICLKCLAKEAAKRYGSAEALAEDLERWLAGEPVRARPSSAWERAGKWARRRPAIAALIALLLVSLVTGLGGILWQWRQAVVARGEAANKAEAEGRARKKAEKAQEDEAAARRRADDERQRAEGLYLTAQSELTRPGNPGLALLLGIEGARRHPGLLANNALLAALEDCWEERTLIGHEGIVLSAAFSPDGQRAITGSDDKTARIWNVDTGETIAVLRGHEHGVFRVLFSPDGRRVVTADSDLHGFGLVGRTHSSATKVTVRAWDAVTGRRLAQWQDPGKDQDANPISRLLAESVNFSPDGRRVVTTFGHYPDCPARVHEAETGKELLALKGHHGPVLSAEFSPDGQRILTASADKTARLWEADTGKLVHTLKHPYGVGFALFSRDGSRVLTVGNGLEIAMAGNATRETREQVAGRLWDAATGKELRALTWPAGAGLVATAAISPDGRRVVTAGDDPEGHWGPYGFPCVWDAATGKQLIPNLGRDPEGESSPCAQFSPDGRWILTHSNERWYARLWDAATGKARDPWRGHKGVVYAAAFSPDGRRVVTASADKTARVWNAAVGPESGPKRGRWGDISIAKLTSDGKRLLEVSHSNRQLARLWDVATGTELRAFQGHSGDISQAAFSPDGTKLLTATFDKTARVWDVATGKELSVLKGHAQYIVAAQFSADGRRVVTVGRQENGRVWDCATGKQLFTLEIEKARAAPQELEGGVQVATTNADPFVVFSPDGKRILTPGSSEAEVLARLWDASTGKELGFFKRPKARVTCLSAEFTADGEHVLTNTLLGASMWRVATGKEEVVFKDRSGWRGSFARLSPDGRRVLTQSGTKSATIWDARTGREIVTLKGHEQEVVAGAFSPDGKLAVTRSADGTARIWDAATGAEWATLKGVAYATPSFSADGRLVLTVGLEVRRWPVDPLALALRRKPRELTKEEWAPFDLEIPGAR